MQNLVSNLHIIIMQQYITPHYKNEVARVPAGSQYLVVYSLGERD